MKKYFLLLLAVLPALGASAQSRGVKIGFIDMEYILEKVPDYAEAKNQLEIKAQKWKQEIEVKKTDIVKLRDGLKAEKALLTKELIEEREEEIRFLENELMDYQEKRFGPKGDLISQKSVLVKPIQDQVFTIVQDISELKKYDFVFDKSSDLTMLFAAQRHDISDLVVRRLTRSAKREQLSGKEIKKLEEQEAQEDLADDPDYAERQQKLDDKKAQREKLLADRKAVQEEKKKAYDERRARLLQERDAKRNGTAAPKTTTTGTTPATGTNDDLDSGDDDPVSTPAGTNTNRPGTTATQPKSGTTSTVQGENANEVKTTATDTPDEGQSATVDKQNAAQAAKDERAQQLEEKKKAIEERKKKILADREAAKKAREEQKNKATEENKNK